MSWLALRYWHEGDLVGKRIRAEDLRKATGLSDLNRLIQVLYRIQRKRGRGLVSVTEEPFFRGQFSNRNWHHLTPQARKGELYHGESRSNFILLRINRHKAWHRLFGLMTLEETITLLVRCREVSIGVWVAANLAAAFRKRRSAMAGQYCLS